MGERAVLTLTETIPPTVQTYFRSAENAEATAAVFGGR
jgi:hypothetical protein